MNFVHYRAPPPSREASLASSSRTTPSCGSSTPPNNNDNKTNAADMDLNIIDERITITDENGEAETSTRPRLTREQVLMLEKQFQLHPKPNSATKRHMAELTNLTIPRVANWFQNRRAKAKQMRKQKELEELQAAQTAAPQNFIQPAQSASPNSVYFQPEYFPSDMSPTPRQSTAPGMPFDVPSMIADDSYGLASFNVAASIYSSLSDFALAANTALPPDHQFEDSSHAVSQAQAEASLAFASQQQQHPFANTMNVNLPAAPFSGLSSRRTSTTAWTPCTQQDDPFDFASKLGMEQRQLLQQSHYDQQYSSPETDFEYPTMINHQSTFNDPFVLSRLPSELVQEQLMQYGQCNPVESERQPSHTPEMEADLSSQDSSTSDYIERLEKSIADQQPSFSSPPEEAVIRPSEGPLNIAARRNRPRPVPLALRSHSYTGPSATSPTTKTPLHGPPSPMRRIKSAVGPNLGLMRGRIHKSTPGSAQRSPLNFETFADANMLSDPRLNIHRAPSVSVNGSLAPPTPMTPANVDLLNHPEAAASQSLAENAFTPGDSPKWVVSPPAGLDSNLASPPITPHGGDHLYARCMANYGTSPPQSAGLLSPFAYTVSDEPVISPQFNSFPSTIHMPQPIYVSPISSADSDIDSLVHCKPFPQEASIKAEGFDSNSNSNMQAYPDFFPHHHDSAQRQAPAVAAPPPPPPLAVKEPAKPQQKTYIFANQTPADF